MALKLVYRCSCGEIYDTDDASVDLLEAHLAANPTHAASESYADPTTGTGLSDEYTVTAPDSTLFRIGVTNDGALTTVNDGTGQEAARAPKNNFAANTDPTATDDDSEAYEVGSRWINVTTDAAFTCVDASTGAAVWDQTNGGGSADLGSVTVEDSVGNTDIPLTWTDLAFDTTVVENDIAVVEHDNTNTDRITVKETGLYLIAWSLECDDEIQVRVRVNDTTVIAGPVQAGDPGDVNDVHVINARTQTVELTANDFLTLQIQAATTAEVLEPGGTFSVTRMRGIQGPSGPPGAGSTVNVEDDGVSAGSPFDTLNFTGAGVTATDAGGGQVDIDIPGFSPNIAQYRQTGNLTINTTATTVALNATDFEDSNYSRSGSDITINTAGIYKVFYSVFFDTNTNSRRTIDVWVENNAVEIVPSRSGDYARNNTDDTGSAGASFFVQLAASDVLRLRAESTGSSGSCLGIGNRMWIALELVRTV